MNHHGAKIGEIVHVVGCLLSGNTPVFSQFVQRVDIILELREFFGKHDGDLVHIQMQALAV